MLTVNVANLCISECFTMFLKFAHSMISIAPKALDMMKFSGSQNSIKKQMKSHQTIWMLTIDMGNLLIFYRFYVVFELPRVHDLDRFRGILEIRRSLDYGRRSNIFQIMFSAQFWFLEAFPGSHIIQILLVFKMFVRTLKSSMKCFLGTSHPQCWHLFLKFRET